MLPGVAPGTIYNCVFMVEKNQTQNAAAGKHTSCILNAT